MQAMRDTIANEQQRKKRLEQLFKARAELLTARIRLNDWQQDVVKTYFAAPEYNFKHWQKSAWIDQYQYDSKQLAPESLDDGVMRLRHRDGGHLEVAKEYLGFDDTAAHKNSIIEDGIIHAKTAWQGQAIGLTGEEDFKARAWAFAQIHGVTIKDYEPQGGMMVYAQEIIKKRTGTAPERPEQRQKRDPGQVSGLAA